MPPLIGSVQPFQQQQQRMVPVPQRPALSSWPQAPGAPPACRGSASASPKPLRFLQPSLPPPPFKQMFSQQPRRQVSPPLAVAETGTLAGPSRSAPLAAALHNADCVRRGQASPWPGAWSGCCMGPWCNKSRSHAGECNTRATIPGLSAYLPEELAAMGLPVLVELEGPLPPAAASAAAAASESAGALQLSLGPAAEIDGVEEQPAELVQPKRKASQMAVAPASSSEGSESLLASDNVSNNGDEEEEEDATTRAPQRESKRKKAAAALKEENKDQDGDAATDNEAVSDEHKSTLTEEAKLRPAAESAGTPKVGKAVRRGHPVPRGKAAGKQAAAGTDSAPLTGAAARPGKRSPAVWISGEAVDPRTGDKVTVVPPATFCTQCGALNTPVWRAGPFGHKTLCNACGVRWMKVVPKRR